MVYVTLALVKLKIRWLGNYEAWRRGESGISTSKKVGRTSLTAKNAMDTFYVISRKLYPITLYRLRWFYVSDYKRIDLCQSCIPLTINLYTGWVSCMLHTPSWNFSLILGKIFYLYKLTLNMTLTWLLNYFFSSHLFLLSVIMHTIANDINFNCYSMHKQVIEATVLKRFLWRMWLHRAILFPKSNSYRLCLCITQCLKFIQVGYHLLEERNFFL